MSNEDFLKDNQYISNLKLRLSYGKNGNQAVDPYRTLSALTAASYVDGATPTPGYVPQTLGNPDLGWESTKSTNLGIDFGFLKGRISGTLDFYSAQTSGSFIG